MPYATLQGSFELVRVAAALEAEPHPACLLGANGEILIVNEAWDAFARRNGGAPTCLGENLLGKNYFNFIDGTAPRAYYESVWHRALGGRCVVVESECNSDVTLRGVSSSFRPVRIGGLSAVVIAHRVVRERDVGSGWANPSDLSHWVNDDGRLVMCSSCRSVRLAAGGGWDFVPTLVQAPSAATVHVFCPHCEARAMESERQ